MAMKVVFSFLLLAIWLGLAAGAIHTRGKVEVRLCFERMRLVTRFNILCHVMKGKRLRGQLSHLSIVWYSSYYSIKNAGFRVVDDDQVS